MIEFEISVRKYVGINHSLWKGGKSKKKSYEKINDKFVHNINMEEKLGRSLKKNEMVHHIDQDKKNNTFENLLLCECIGIHRSIHSQFYELTKKISLFFLKNKIIIFEKINSIYNLNPEKILSSELLNDSQKKELLEKTKLSEQEIKKINERRKEIIENQKKPSLWDTIEGRKILKEMQKMDEESFFGL